MAKKSHNAIHQLSLDFDSEPAASLAIDSRVPVVSSTPLPVARVWFRKHLERTGRSESTIESYSYDLVVLEQRVGAAAINRINETDIAAYLADASSRTTRKRRLTTVKAFWTWLIEDLKVLDLSPAADFSPHPLQHDLPEILTPEESAALMEAAANDEAWSAPAIWLMLHLGLGRNELLALQTHHIDRTPQAGPEVEVRYESAAMRAKDRTLQTTPKFGELLNAFWERKRPEGVLFPYGPQAVNGMVDRVTVAASIERRVTPQILRHTAAVRMASEGLSVNELLARLGLANDARNRETGRLYIAAAKKLGLLDEEGESA